MSSKTIYWISGIAAAVILGVLLWAPLNRDNTDTPHTTPSSDHSSEDTGHNSAADTSSPEHRDENLNAYLEEQDKVMQTMMEQMEDVNPSGLSSIDFLNGMIPHHDAAIAMAESYLRHGGTQKELKPLAESIIDTQKKEIEQMNQMVQNLKDSGVQNREQEEAYLKKYEEMLSGHHTSHQTAGDTIDTAFAEGMIMHHQMAVDMAKDILENTDDEGVLALAQTIINTQEQEIAQMQKLLPA